MSGRICTALTFSLGVVTICLIILTLTGCAMRRAPAPPPTIVRVVETVEVKVPVIVRATPPQELLAPLRTVLPVFVAPTHAGASSALTVEGERVLRAFVQDLLTYYNACRAFISVAPQ